MRAEKEEKVDEVKRTKKDFFSLCVSFTALDQVQHTTKYNEFCIKNYSGRSSNSSFLDIYLL
jgi:hypothetical protein